MRSRSSGKAAREEQLAEGSTGRPDADSKDERAGGEVPARDAAAPESNPEVAQESLNKGD